LARGKRGVPALLLGLGQNIKREPVGMEKEKKKDQKKRRSPLPVSQHGLVGKKKRKRVNSWSEGSSKGNRFI